MSFPELQLVDTGKPDGRVRAPAVTNKKKWTPSTWEPMFDEWVLRSVLGMSNLAIAEKYKYTPQHVSVILNTAQAKLLRRQLHENLRKSIELKTEERIAHLQDKSLVRMSAVLDDDDLARDHPFAMFDRAERVLKGTGVLKSDQAAGITAKNAIFVAPELARGILEGMRMADKAKLLNPIEEVELVDVTPKK